jgi:hypothetical protein
VTAAAQPPAFDTLPGRLFTPRPVDLRTRDALPSWKRGDGRVMLRISENDREAYLNAEPGWAPVTDLVLGQKFEARRAACDAACFCAAEIRLL